MGSHHIFIQICQKITRNLMITTTSLKASFE
jgi:hypothetical protein